MCELYRSLSARAYPSLSAIGYILRHPFPSPFSLFRISIPLPFSQRFWSTQVCILCVTLPSKDTENTDTFADADTASERDGECEDRGLYKRDSMIDGSSGRGAGKNKFMKRHLFIMSQANGEKCWRVYRSERWYTGQCDGRGVGWLKEMGEMGEMGDGRNGPIVCIAFRVL